MSWRLWKKTGVRVNPNPVQPVQEVDDEERKEVTLLMDVESLLENSKDDPEQKRLGYFLDYISFQEKKDIIFFEVFAPSSLASNAESVVFQLYSASVVYMPFIPAPVIHKCPRNLVTKFHKVRRQNGNRELKGELKSVDGVDNKIVARGKDFIKHIKNLYEIIVVSNDGDFRELKNYAKSRGIHFRLYPPSEAFSKDYLRTNNGEKEVFLLKGGDKSTE